MAKLVLMTLLCYRISSLQLWFLCCYQCIPWVQLHVWWQWSFPIQLHCKCYCLRNRFSQSCCSHPVWWCL